MATEPAPETTGLPVFVLDGTSFDDLAGSDVSGGISAGKGEGGPNRCDTLTAGIADA